MDVQDSLKQIELIRREGCTSSQSNQNSSCRCSILNCIWIRNRNTVDPATLSDTSKPFKDSRHSQVEEVEMTANTTTASAMKAPQGITRNLLKKLAVAAGVLIIAFLLGYVPSSISSRSTQRQNAELERQLRVTDLGNQLAMASYEANRNNYASATEFSTRFFNGLPEIITESKDQPLRQKLQAMLLHRDEITSNPAQVDQTVKEKLAQMYAEYFQATQPNKKSGQ
jgi:hypothetical protein